MKLNHFLILSIGVFINALPAGAYGQRVYATVQQNGVSLPLLANIDNPQGAVDTIYTNFSTLNVSIGGVGLVYAQQNLQFTGALRPSPSSPIIIKFGAGNTLLGLVNALIVQRTNGGMNTTVGTAYSSSRLATLITSNAGSNATEVSIPIPGPNTASDGIRLRINTALGVGVAANLFYAFFIVPPIPVNTAISICEGETGLIEIANFQPGYTYLLYDSLIGGAPILSGNSQVISFNVADLSSGNYYLEAIEPGTDFASARAAIQIVKYSKPGNPDIVIHINEN
ncbi:hypothetical protein [Galbibacter sp. PAP.153]|uniref:immunoglobulin domain-containing protein n=1 Tax=Galbibacter sp. PAP.153 TaxID=3104623 RepID=UPI00300B7136